MFDCVWVFADESLLAIRSSDGCLVGLSPLGDRVTLQPSSQDSSKTRRMLTSCSLSQHLSTIQALLWIRNLFASRPYLLRTEGDDEKGGNGVPGTQRGTGEHHESVAWEEEDVQVDRETGCVWIRSVCGGARVCVSSQSHGLLAAVRYRPPSCPHHTVTRLVVCDPPFQSSTPWLQGPLRLLEGTSAAAAATSRLPEPLPGVSTARSLWPEPQDMYERVCHAVVRVTREGWMTMLSPQVAVGCPGVDLTAPASQKKSPWHLDQLAAPPCVCVLDGRRAKVTVHVPQHSTPYIYSLNALPHTMRALPQPESSSHFRAFVGTGMRDFVVDRQVEESVERTLMGSPEGACSSPTSTFSSPSSWSSTLETSPSPAAPKRLPWDSDGTRIEKFVPGVGQFWYRPQDRMVRARFCQDRRLFTVDLQSGMCEILGQDAGGKDSMNRVRVENPVGVEREVELMMRFCRSMEPPSAELLTFAEACRGKEEAVAVEASAGVHFSPFDYQEEYVQAVASTHLRKLKCLRALLAHQHTGGTLPADLRESSGFLHLDEMKVRRQRMEVISRAERSVRQREWTAHRILEHQIRARDTLREIRHALEEGALCPHFLGTHHDSPGEVE